MWARGDVVVREVLQHLAERSEQFDSLAAVAEVRIGVADWREVDAVAVHRLKDGRIASDDNSLAGGQVDAAAKCIRLRGKLSDLHAGEAHRLAASVQQLDELQVIRVGHAGMIGRMVVQFGDSHREQFGQRERGIDKWRSNPSHS